MSAKKKEKMKKIAWQGTAGIEQAAALKKELEEAINSSSAVELDIQAIDDIDITGIQLILSAQKEAALKEIPFTLATPVPELIDSFCNTIGISLESLKPVPQEEATHA